MIWRTSFLERRILTLIALSSLIALQLSALLIIAYQWQSQRRLLVREMATTARILAETTSDTVLSWSNEEVERILDSLEHDGRVLAAEVSNIHGRVVASYRRDSSTDYSFSTQVAPGESFDRRGLTWSQPILREGKAVGTLNLRADLSSLNRELASAALAILSAMTLCTILVLVFARRFTRILSRPIVDLQEIAKAVSESSDYSLRVERRSDDELGALTEAFNEMLEEIEARDEDLRRTHSELQAWVVELKRSQERERELTERLSRSEKMESLGILAGGVAHDLNNILGPIVGYPDLMMESLEDDSPMRRHLQLIRDSAIRAAAIVQDLLTLAGRGSYPLKPVSLSRVVRDYLDGPDFEVSYEGFEAVALDVRLCSEDSVVEASGSHLGQVVMNLVLNALEAMPGGGQLRIRTYETVLVEELAGFERIPAGAYSVLAVSDSGDGINEDDLGRVFEPFFSKKHLGHSGSGLGLAVVWSVVKDLDGFVDVRATSGEGTTFKVYLPVIQACDSSGLSGDELFGTESILVVDDEPVQRDLALALLESLGYEVVTCDSGRAALEYLDHHDVDLVILDMIMEEDFDGLTTYRHIARRKPSQACVLASGFSDSARVKEALEIGACGYVPKPYTREEIGEAVRLALGKRVMATV